MDQRDSTGREMHNQTRPTDANNHPFGDMKYVRTGADTRNRIQE